MGRDNKCWDRIVLHRPYLFIALSADNDNPELESEFRHSVPMHITFKMLVHFRLRV